MSSMTFVILFLAIAFFSLILVSFVNQRQMRRRLITRQVHQLKRKVAELEELTVSIDPLVEDSAIVQIINDEVIDLIRTMMQLSPESYYLEANLNNALELKDSFSESRRQREIYRVQSSDAAIARSQYLLNEAGRIIRRRQTKGMLEVSQMEAYIHDLAWAHLMVGVASTIAHGHRAVSRGDVLQAHAYYKKAKQIAMQTNNPDDRRHQLIKEISEIMNGRRKALSRNLMPETQVNPVETETPPPQVNRVAGESQSE